MNRAERVLALLTARYPGWVPAIELEAPGGRQAWRTAVSEARALAKADGGDVENQIRHQARHEPSCASWQAWDIPQSCTCTPRVWTLSEYRLKKADEYQLVASTQGHDINSAAPGRMF